MVVAYRWLTRQTFDRGGDPLTVALCGIQIALRYFIDAAVGGRLHIGTDGSAKIVDIGTLGRLAVGREQSKT